MCKVFGPKFQIWTDATKQLNFRKSSKGPLTLHPTTPAPPPPNHASLSENHVVSLQKLPELYASSYECQIV